jgi:copper transport protein
VKRALAAILLVCALAALAPASASAHARLEGTSPPEGATVAHEPAAVIFRFDEPVEGNFGAVRVYDASGGRVDEGDAFHPNGEGPRLSVHLEPGLPDGSYTATYRVVSADGHIVSSGFVFSIGKQGKAPQETVAQLIGGAGSGPVTETAFGIARGLQYAAIALGFGGLLFLLLVWLPALRAIGDDGAEWAGAERAFLRRLRTLLWVAAALGAISAAASIVLEGAEAAGVSGFSALDETIVRETLGTRFGTIWGFVLVAWVVLAAALPLLLGRRRGRLLLAVPLAFAVIAPALSGHGSTQSPVLLNFPVNVIHVGAMAIWLGGLAALLLALPAATRALAAADRSSLLAVALSRFSRLALIAVAAILATGLIQAYVYVRHLGDLLSTGYGRAVLAKFLLLLAVIGLGAFNRRRSLPRLEKIAAGGGSPGRDGVLLRRALRAEAALLVVVLGVTAALASYAPPVSAGGGPFATTTTLGPTQLEMSVDPARVGANQIHLYFFDSKSGAQYSKGKELIVTATLPDKHIGPLPLAPQLSGPGHYTIPSALLNVAGDWQLEVTLRVSAFDEFSKSIEVSVG